MPTPQRSFSPHLLSLAAVLAPLGAQDAPPPAAKAPSAQEPAGKAPAAQEPAANAPAAAAIGTEGLPTFLLPVPAGKVVLGTSIEKLAQAACETVNPAKPELALKAPEKLARNLRQTASLLGQETRDVPAFLLGKWPVTNKEYRAFLEKMTANGVKMRPPFHWWRFGKKDDYDKKLEDIVREFKADGKAGPELYWKRYGETLPWDTKDENGKPIDDLPVVFVSRRDMVRFAGWLGMRLPTEEERTRAVRGDSAAMWPWGVRPGGKDSYQEAVLASLKLANLKDRHLNPVGSNPFLNGPFGHVDLTGQVWEMVARTGYTPIGGYKAFDAEWDRAQKDKAGALLKDRPAWKDDPFLIKGGSYLSAGDPIQFLVDCRVPVQDEEVLESMGFRLAKSLKPGYDLMYSLVSSDYNMDLFEGGAEGQKVDFANQVGLERYVLAADGFPTEYHAMSFAPVTWLSAEKSGALPKLVDKSQTTPLLLGTLAVTDPVFEPKLPAGHYSVAYRKSGMPKELKDAIKAGYKEVQAELKRKAAAEKAGGEPEPAKPEGEEKKSPWRAVLTRYGIQEKDLEEKGAEDSIEFVRLGEFVVPTKTNVFLFFDNAGKWVAHCKAPDLVAGNVGASEVSFVTGKSEKAEHAKVEFKIRGTLLKDQKKGVEYTLDLLMEQAPPQAGETWRLPAAPAAASNPKK